MGLFARRGRTQAENTTQQPAGSARDRLAWLPGAVQVAVAGETFHADAIRTVQWASSPGKPLVAVLTPEPDNFHDPHAVAVHLNGQHVGYLPREVAARVQPALVRFGQEHGGCLVSTPAEIRMHDLGPEIVLWLDPRPLGVSAEAFQVVPDLDAAIGRLIGRLDEPAPVLDGVNEDARAALAAAEDSWARTEAEFDRGPQAWQRVEREFRQVISQLTDARDPLVSTAWLGAGRSTRYQKGRRDDTLRAFIEVLYWGRSNSDAWADLVEMASAAPHLPTLTAIYGRIPSILRPTILPLFLAMSYGHDRLGRLNPAAGAQLRIELMRLAESQGDRESVAILAGEAGLRAEKAGDLDAAVTWWRRAVAAGSADEKVADRFSIWLTKRHEFREAEAVLRQALAARPQSAAVADRLRRRLARCERSIAG
jgi:tetratricopeptide (TPR) repeat protein